MTNNENNLTPELATTVVNTSGTPKLASTAVNTSRTPKLATTVVNTSKGKKPKPSNKTKTNSFIIPTYEKDWKKKKTIQ
jgi:hypothetical protein